MKQNKNAGKKRYRTLARLLLKSIPSSPSPAGHSLDLIGDKVEWRRLKVAHEEVISLSLSEEEEEEEEEEEKEEEEEEEGANFRVLHGNDTRIDNIHSVVVKLLERAISFQQNGLKGYRKSKENQNGKKVRILFETDRFCVYQSLPKRKKKEKNRLHSQCNTNLTLTRRGPVLSK